MTGFFICVECKISFEEEVDDEYDDACCPDRGEICPSHEVKGGE